MAHIRRQSAAQMIEELKQEVARLQYQNNQLTKEVNDFRMKQSIRELEERGEMPHAGENR